MKLLTLSSFSFFAHFSCESKDTPSHPPTHLQMQLTQHSNCTCGTAPHHMHRAKLQCTHTSTPPHCSVRLYDSPQLSIIITSLCHLITLSSIHVFLFCEVASRLKASSGKVRVPYHTIPHHTTPYHTPHHTTPHTTPHTIPYHTISLVSHANPSLPKEGSGELTE